MSFFLPRFPAFTRAGLCTGGEGKERQEIFVFVSVAPQVCDFFLLLPPWHLYPPLPKTHFRGQPPGRRYICLPTARPKKKKKIAPKRITQSVFYERANVTTGFKGARNPARVIKLYERDGGHF